MRSKVPIEYHRYVDMFEKISFVQSLSDDNLDVEMIYEDYDEPKILYLAKPFATSNSILEIKICVETQYHNFWHGLIEFFDVESLTNKFRLSSQFCDCPEKCINDLLNKLSNQSDVLTERIPVWKSTNVDVSQKNAMRGHRNFCFSENSDKHMTHRFDYYKKNKKETDWTVYSFKDPQCYGKGKNPVEAWDDMISFAKHRQDLMKTLHNLMNIEGDQ